MDIIENAEAIKLGKVTLAHLVRDSLTLVDMASRLCAVASATNLGTIYKDMKLDLEGMAHLQMALDQIEESAEQIYKASRKALNGSEDSNGDDGHYCRFADCIRASGAESIEFDFGSFRAKPKLRVWPPSKKADALVILQWQELCVKENFNDRICTGAQADEFARKHKKVVPKYMAYHYWLRDQGLLKEDCTFPALQKHCNELSRDLLPEFLTVKVRNEVKRS